MRTTTAYMPRTNWTPTPRSRGIDNRLRAGRFSFGPSALTCLCAKTVSGVLVSRGFSSKEGFDFVFFDLVDLSTGLVVSTTCSLTICLTTCKVGVNIRRFLVLIGVNIRNRSKLSRGGYTWITPPNHHGLWISLKAAKTQDAPGAAFSGALMPEGHPRPCGADSGVPCGENAETSGLAGLDLTARWSVSRDAGSRHRGPSRSSASARPS